MNLLQNCFLILRSFTICLTSLLQKEKNINSKIIDWFKRLFGKNTTHQDLINKIVDNVIEFNAYQTLEQREDSYDYIPDVLPAASKREEIASIKLRSVFSDMVKTAENRMASLRYNVIEDKFDRNEIYVMINCYLVLEVSKIL